jgi:hypothetical protein
MTNLDISSHCGAGDWAPGAAMSGQLPHRELTAREVVAHHMLEPWVRATMALNLSCTQGYVATLWGSTGFDPRAVLVESVRADGLAPKSATLTDVNGDGRVDLVLVLVLASRVAATNSHVTGLMSSLLPFSASGFVSTTTCTP